MSSRQTAAIAFIIACGAARVLAQTAPVTLATMTQAETRYVFEIAPDRASRQPLWDQRAAPEPELSMKDARRVAETWLLSHNPEIKTLALTSEMIIRSGPTGIWYYRVAYDPIVGGRRLIGGPAFMVFVLLDRSIVEPRVEPAQNPAAATQATTAAAVAPRAPAAPVTTTSTSPVAAPGAPATPVPVDAILELAEAVYRPGNGVVAPRVLQQVAPHYTAAAAAAKIEGTAVLRGSLTPTAA
jgi:hypothetical protein